MVPVSKSTPIPDTTQAIRKPKDKDGNAVDTVLEIAGAIFDGVTSTLLDDVLDAFF